MRDTILFGDCLKTLKEFDEKARCCITSPPYYGLRNYGGEDNQIGLEAAVFLRNMDYIGISQTIGRVIRKGGENKTYGLISVPVYDRVGISSSRKVESVVDTIFNQGQPAISVITK